MLAASLYLLALVALAGGYFVKLGRKTWISPAD